MAFWNTVMDTQEDVLYGKALLPCIIDDTAAKDPGRICFSILRTGNISDGFYDLSFRTFSTAINKTAHFIQREIGRSSMFETVMYMGHPDVRHYIVLIALMKTGHKVLFSSHRNSVAAHANLIKRTDCTVLLHTEGFPVSGILETCRMESLCMPDLEYLLDESPCEPYPYERTFDEAKNHPVMVVHSSSSTSLPKPIIWTHWTLNTGEPRYIVHPVETRPIVWGGIFENCRRAYMALPVHYGAGIGMAISATCFDRTTILLGPPDCVTADVLGTMLDVTNVDAVAVVPETLEDAADKQDVLSKLGRLSFAAVVGGALSPNTNQKIAQRVRAFAIVAGTVSPPISPYATVP